MDVTFSINYTELNDKFLKTLRELFEGKNIRITISEETDNPTYFTNEELAIFNENRAEYYRNPENSYTFQESIELVRKGLKK